MLFAAQHCHDLALLLTDIVLFGKSGSAIAQAIHAQVAGAKIVFMSGYSLDAMRENGVVTDDEHFLQKPFTRTTLLQTIQKLLRPSATRSSSDSRA